MNTYPHLHVHSHYTLLGGTASPAALAQRAAAEGLTHLALTDTHALYGAVAFTQACQAVGVQPILGMTVAVAPPDDLPPLPDAPPGQLVLLAAGVDGYRSLCRLSALLQAHPDREARLARGLTLADLRAHTAGLLCLTGGRQDWLAAYLRAGDARNARRYAGKLAGIYEDALYLSLELAMPTDTALAAELTAAGDFLGLPLVAVAPVYCLEAGDRDTLCLLAAIERQCRLADLPLTALPDGGDPQVALHWLTPAEMAARYQVYPEALARTQEIVARCASALPTGRRVWPVLDLPAGETPETALTAAAYAHPLARVAQAAAAASPVLARLDSELTAINCYGYAPLFLIVADIVQYARMNDIPVSTRGSVANSLVAYCLGITTVDSLAHDLLFERFLSPARADVPDIDLDFCSRRRDEVLAYVRERYGAERVALVGTVNTLQPRAALRAVAKAYGLDEAALRPLLSAFPAGWGGPRRRPPRPLADVLATVGDPQQQTLVRAAYALIGQPQHLSVHPGGVVITPGPLTDVTPVQWAPKGWLITQFPHADVAAVGLPKLDLLGIRALTVLADAAALVRRDHDPDFQLATIPLDDPATAALLAQGDTVGVFQCESEGARRTLRQLRARTVADLAVANAFFKPGPATGGQAAAFVRRYRGEAPVRYLHPALAPILAPTKGVLLFQEQILRVAVEIAGLSWAQADHLRRGMSQMDGATMAQMQAAFEAGCQRPPPAGSGFDAAQAHTLWEQVAQFAGYGFNQGHATAYADVSYRSAYLKAHYPAAFLCARLQDWGGYHHPAVYLAEAVRLGVTVRGPDVHHSGRNYRLTWEAEHPVLWLGLGLVRDLRRATVQTLLRARAARPFADGRDLITRVPLAEKELTHLIQCGALDGLGSSRAALLAEVNAVRRAGSGWQLSLGLTESLTPPETVAERWAWEKRLLGYPLAALRAWLPELRAAQPETVWLADLVAHPGRPGSVIAVRLPGWGRGSIPVWDGATWALARLPADIPAPPAWAPALWRGRWAQDAWGMGWVQVEGLESEL